MIDFGKTRLPLRVYVDMDNTVNNLTAAFFNFLDMRKVPHDSVSNSYDLQSSIFHPNKKKIFKEIMNSPEFWSSIPALPAAVEVLSALNNIVSLYIATIPFNKQTEQVKFDTIRRQLPFLRHDQILFVEDKWDLEGDIIIEDKPETLKRCGQADFITIKKRQLYNTNISSHFEFTHWDEMRVVLPKALALALETKNKEGL